MTDPEKVWLILRYQVEDSTVLPVGVFFREETALRVVEELMDVFESHEFELIELATNTVYVQNQEEIDDMVSITVESLVKSGLVDYKIGEDGKFYYELTEDGKKAMEDEEE